MLASAREMTDEIRDKKTTRPERDFGEAVLCQAAVGKMVACILEVDTLIDRYAQMFDKLQPSVEGKITVRWLVPAGGMKRRSMKDMGDLASGGPGLKVAYGRRAQFVRWRPRTGVEPGKETSSFLALYEEVKPERVLQSLQRKGRFARTSTEVRDTCKVLVGLMKRRDVLLNVLIRFRRTVSVEALRESKRLPLLNQQAALWEPHVEKIFRSERARVNERRKKMMSAVSVIEDVRLGEKLPAAPNPSKVAGRIR